MENKNIDNEKKTRRILRLVGIIVILVGIIFFVSGNLNRFLKDLDYSKAFIGIGIILILAGIIFFVIKRKKRR